MAAKSPVDSPMLKELTHLQGGIVRDTGLFFSAFEHTLTISVILLSTLRIRERSADPT
jgi:hypothetical protein